MNTDNLKITVIIATYNAHLNLQKALDSLKLQTSKDFELIVVDGASTDNTLDIIKSNSDIITQYISAPDEGIYDAWNKGIKVAQGEYIMFLGADDILLPGALDAYIRFIEKNGHNFDIISSKLDYVNERGKHLKFVGEPWNWNKFKMNRMSFAHTGMLHNVRLFIKNGPFDITYKICGDLEFLLRTQGNIITGFMDAVTIKMQQGGISYSVKAIIEAYQIRKNKQILSTTENYLRLLYMLVRFCLSKIKQKIYKVLYK